MMSRTKLQSLNGVKEIYTHITQPLGGTAFKFVATLVSIARKRKRMCQEHAAHTWCGCCLFFLLFLWKGKCKAMVKHIADTHVSICWSSIHTKRKIAEPYGRRLKPPAARLDKKRIFREWKTTERKANQEGWAVFQQKTNLPGKTIHKKIFQLRSFCYCRRDAIEIVRMYEHREHNKDEME